MKANKLFRKLALSGVALGAAAVTLTATTFAWYTSNTEADVTAVTAQTEAKSSASLFIATASEYDGTGATGYKQATDWNDYLAKATPTVTGSVDGTANAYVLKPVFSNYGTVSTSVSGRAYNKIAEVTGTNKDTVTYAAENAGDFMEFVFRVRTSAGIDSSKDLYFSEFNLSAAATDASVATTQVPLAGGDGTGITSKNAVYGASLLKALKLDVTSADVDLDADSAIPAEGSTSRKAGASAETDTVTTYGFESLGGSDTNIGTANAVGYYNKVMGTNIAAPTTGYNVGTETFLIDLTAADADTQKSGKTPVKVATIPATTSGDDFSVVEIRFVLYLDGWDNYCYDIMQGQKVNFSFQLTTEANSAVLYKTQA